MQCRSGAFDHTAAHHVARDAARAAGLAFRLVENQQVGLKLEQICFCFYCDGFVSQPLESINNRNAKRQKSGRQRVIGEQVRG
jgi:hypothetical protein